MRIHCNTTRIDKTIPARTKFRFNADFDCKISFTLPFSSSSSLTLRSNRLY